VPDLYLYLFLTSLKFENGGAMGCYADELAGAKVLS
jgi:hypothetical protein